MVTYRFLLTLAVVPAVSILAACDPPDRLADAAETSRPTATDTAVEAPAAGVPAAGVPAGVPAAGVPAAAVPAAKPIERAARRSAPAPAPTGSAASSPRRVVINGVDLTGLGYDKGSATAPVVVVNFSDFGCPFCGSFARETEPVLVKEYVETGKVFIKHVPFVMGMFPNGRQAARAAECAGEQGKFWPMHDRLYDQQTAWKRSLAPFGVFRNYARAIGLDEPSFAKCYTGDMLHPRTARANDAASQFGVRATPSFIVNGRGVEGALPLPQFRMLLDEVLRSGR